MRSSTLKRATESIFAVQEQAITTKYIQRNVLHPPIDDTCRVCNIEKETVHHIVSGCGTLAPTKYLQRHDNVCKYFMPIKRQKKRCWLTYYPTTISQYPTKASGKVAKLHRSCCWTEIAVGPKSGKNCLNNYWSNGNCLGDDVKKVHLNSIKFDISPEDNAVGYWHIISFLILPNCFVVTLILSRKPQTSINGIRKIYLYRKRFWKLQCHQLL